MRDITKYRGIFPAFYACYKKDGSIDTEAVEIFTRHLVGKGVKGLYVGGSSGECIYQSVNERKLLLEHAVKAAEGKVTIIAHVACNNTEDSCELARHAEGLGVDAIASIPPIYFHLPPEAVAKYWNDISDAAPNTDFFIYNIPQLAGVSLTVPLLREMIRNPRVAGVKNSSMPTQDIQMFKAEGGKDFAVMNGPDEQLLSGLAIGADGGIGGTYAVMPELYLKIYELAGKGEYESARPIQYAADAVIYKVCEAKGNLYAVMKEILRRREGIDIGGVRAPLPEIAREDMPVILEAAEMIDRAIAMYC